MSQILINDTETVEGSFSFEVTIDETVTPTVYSITGLFTTADKYIEELNSIQSNRYRVEGIKVYRESYGSEDFSIVYYFTAKAFGLLSRYAIEDDENTDEDNNGENTDDENTSENNNGEDTGEDVGGGD